MIELRHERHTFRSMRLEEGRYVPADITVDAEVLDHASGFRLLRLGTNLPYKGAYFRYEKRDVGFYFFADRNHDGGTVAGTYWITHGFNPGEKIGRGAWPLTRAQMQVFAADIDMGLRAWPTTPLEAERPLGVVHFYFFTYASAPDYTFQFGKPLRLRNVSPSARWQKRKVMHRVMWGGPEEPREFSAMVRDDGVQLIRIPTSRGPENDGPDTYHFIASDTSFDFTAGRHFAIEVVTDTWEVRLNPSYRSGFTSALRARLGPARCSEIVHTIEDGLFAWIPEPYEERQRQVPVNRVVFLDAECSDR